jgi:hypothetical protein
MTRRLVMVVRFGMAGREMIRLHRLMLAEEGEEQEKEGIGNESETKARIYV